MPAYGWKTSQKGGPGAYDYRTEQNTGTHLVKWFNSKYLFVGSTFAGVETTTTLEKFDVKQKKKFKCNAMIWWHSIMHLGGKDFPEMLIELYHTKIAPWKSNGSWSSFDTASISLKSILGWLIVYIVDNYMYPVRSVFDFNNAESLHLKVKKSMRSTSSTHYWKLSQHLFQRYQVWQNCTLAWYRLRTFTL